MSEQEVALDCPANFEQRCAVALAQLEAGRPMTIEQLAKQLGLPYEFFAGALAGYAEILGISVMVDLSPPSQAAH
ncbi:hypothetical protein [Bradyrhizobium diazoefficiens]|uniref:hypothetical protein n=1 Tax=Bradyrhizobium diazoefficiens TaxID=1355477 RepID=UPI00347FC2BB